MTPAPTFPSDYASNNPEDYIGDSSDERIATLFVRAEYLIQRMLCGVFTNKDKCEWEMVSFALMLPFDPKGNEYEKGNSLEAFWQLKKDHLYISSTKQILLNRILRGEHLSHSLKAMDLFERSVFFTVLCYYPEFRNWDCAKMLYDTGARFIDCQFSQNAEKIRQFALQKEQKHLFNIVTSTISSEEECQRFWGADTYSDEEGKDDWFSFLEVPRYKDDPDYYKDKTFRNIVYTKQDDPEHKTLAAYYSLFDFITDAIIKT